MNVNFLPRYQLWTLVVPLLSPSPISLQPKPSSSLTGTQPLQTSFGSSCKLVVFAISLHLEFLPAMSSSFFPGQLLLLQTPAVDSLGWFPLYRTSLL